MVRERGTTFAAHKQAKAIKWVTAAVLLIGTFLFAAPVLAQQECRDGTLDHGKQANPVDLKIYKNCRVGDGVFYYNHVNIVAGGSLNFNEVPKLVTSFYARSIVVENGGTLVAGTRGSPFGSQGGSLHIILYGRDQGVHGNGIMCQSPATDPLGKPSRPGQCGIPNDVWDHPGVVPTPPAEVSDRFYPYDPLPFDGDPTGGLKGYFGYKVLAVSYGGSLELFGKVGATYATLQPNDSGTSWVRLASTIYPCKNDKDTDCQTLKSIPTSTGPTTSTLSSPPPITFRTIPRS